MTQNSVNAKSNLVQYAYTLLTSTVNNNSAIPKDDTIPQKTEGTEIMTCSITPTSATNLLVVRSYAGGSSASSGTDIVIALFQDDTSNALAAIEGNFGYLAAWPANGVLTYSMTAGTTSSTTFKIRCGNNVGTTNRVNVMDMGLGYCFMEILEIKA